MSVDHDRLHGALSRLKLTAIRDQIDSLLDEAAKRELSLREALAFLVEREVARKSLPSRTRGRAAHRSGEQDRPLPDGARPRRLRLCRPALAR